MSGLIAHEWIESRGGAENVLEAIAALYPDASIVTPWTDAPERFIGREVRELWLGRSPLRGRKALAVPALAAAWRSAVPRNAKYDWVIVSSHLFAHHIRPRGLSRDVPKLVYAHTPARYIWTPEMDARGSGIAARMASKLLRPLDRRRAAEATAIAANSAFVRDRIRRSWNVDADVIYPPVETSALQSVRDWRDQLTGPEQDIINDLPEQFVLGASRFVPYKRLDLVIAAGAYAGVPVVIAGGGPEAAHLRELGQSARVPVIFVDEPSTALLRALYQAASVYVFPPVEDFGIMPVEAMALGTPVVANPVGGSSETVTEGVSGVHFESLEAADIGRAITRATDLSSADCRLESRRFSRESFDACFSSWIDAALPTSRTDKHLQTAA